VVVHASAILAWRAVIAAPLNYARETAGGSTSLGALMPAFGGVPFLAETLGAIDIFALWALTLASMGLSMLYRRPTFSVARWLFGAYVAAAMLFALTKILLGGQ
jgi:hypothetical protein